MAFAVVVGAAPQLLPSRLRPDWQFTYLTIFGLAGILLASAATAGSGDKFRRFLPGHIGRFFDIDDVDPVTPKYYLAGGITLIAAGTLLAIPHAYAAARHLSRVPFAICLTGFLLSLGSSAHVYKQKSRYWYGFTEIVIAVLFIIDRCMQLNSVDALPSNWGTLVGAVYFLARGLNNWREDGEKRRSH